MTLSSGRRLQFDYAAPDADHGGVSAVVGAQLRQNVLDPAFNRVFSDGKAIGDLLIGVSGGNKLQDVDFPLREGIVGARTAGATDKTIVACVMAEPGRPQPLDAGGERIPAYAFPENAARTLAKVATYAEWRTRPRTAWQRAR